jgi:hypothetical protein
VTSLTQVELSQPNFRLVKADVIGESRGFRLLGLFTFKSPEYVEAITRLYQNAGVSTGKPQTLVNVVYDQTSTYFILFSLPKITVRGDVVEFREGDPPRGGNPGPESGARVDLPSATRSGRP